MIWTLKKCNKKMGSPCLFTCQRALKMGYFYWLHVKNHLYTELSLGYPKDTKFYLDSKASFIDISSILHLSCFWLLGCGNIALFRTVLWLAWSPGLNQNTSGRGLFSKIVPNTRRTFPNIFRKFPKMSEDFRRRPRKTRRCYDDTPTNLSTM